MPTEPPTPQPTAQHVENRAATPAPQPTAQPPANRRRVSQPPQKNYDEPKFIQVETQTTSDSDDSK